MKDMFSIGELARYQNISKQTLIFYDKIGLFRPAYVDPDNKYRYYKASQIDYLDTILIMKEMGFSLLSRWYCSYFPLYLQSAVSCF